MEELRSEIVESMKIRSDFLKWKIIVIATLGAIGFGVTSTSIADSRVILCLIPFVNGYIDLLCKHISLRISVIGEFRKKGYIKKEQLYEGDYIGAYENFVTKARNRGAYSMEKTAVFISSILSAIVLIVFSLIDITSCLKFETKIDFFIFLSGILGIILTLVIEVRYRAILKKIDSINID